MKKLLLILIIFSFYGCYWQRDEIRIGVDDYATSQLLMEAKKLGYLDERFKVIPFSTRGDSVESFYTGGIDVVYSTLFNSVYYYDKGEPGKIFMILDRIRLKDGLIVKKGLKNLKGKKIGIEVNVREYQRLKTYLAGIGMKMEDVVLVAGSNEDLVRKFSRGELDGIFSHLDDLEDMNKLNGELYRGDSGSKSIMEVLVASKKIEKNKKALKKITEAWYEVLYRVVQEPGFIDSLELNYDEITKIQLKRRIRFFYKGDNVRFLKEREIGSKIKILSEEINREVNVEDIYMGEVFDEKRKFYIF